MYYLLCYYFPLQTQYTAEENNPTPWPETQFNAHNIDNCGINFKQFTIQTIKKDFKRKGIFQ
jgi:hypothetical protein